MRHRRRESDRDHGSHQGRHATLAGAAPTGVVMAAAFCETCPPRKPVTTTPIKTATRTTAATRIARRLPRPILVFLTNSLISRSLAMRASPLHRSCRCNGADAPTGSARQELIRAFDQERVSETKCAAGRGSSPPSDFPMHGIRSTREELSGTVECSDRRGGAEYGYGRSHRRGELPRGVCRHGRWPRLASRAWAILWASFMQLCLGHANHGARYCNIRTHLDAQDTKKRRHWLCRPAEAAACRG